MPGMHFLITRARNAIDSWTCDQPRELALGVAALCRDTLDYGGLPTDSTDWRKLRASFDVTAGQSIADSIASWDHWCRYAHVDLTDREAFVKLGIVTWTVKLLLRKLGALAGCDPMPDFHEWKRELCMCLDQYILMGGHRRG